MTFTFEKAIRRQTWAIIGLAGPSGGGKTWTALELATGLAGDGRIALISTEGTRDLYYADHFDFDRLGLEAPYSPARCLEALQAGAAHHSVVIFDSFSDEYIGEGGLCDMAATDKNPNDAAKWARPKAEHKKVIRWIRNSARCHLIFAMRAEEKVKLVKVRKDGRDTTTIVPIGFQPICEKAFMFDMMESALLLPEMHDAEGRLIMADARGVPQWIKPMQQHLPFFPEGKPISRESGRLLAQWCAGGQPLVDPTAIESEGNLAAKQGTASLDAWARTLNGSEKLVVRDTIGPELRRVAQEADNQIAAAQ